MKSLVLAEKPSVAKELARVLGCSQKNKSYSEGSQYIVTWALGHLVTLAEPEDYDKKYKEWKMEDLPMLPEKMKLKVIRETSHQFHAVTKLMERSDIGEFIIATDAGREGELVARWILKLGKWHKPIKRLWISSQTDKAIKEGFANLKPGVMYENLYHAAVCRSEADWLIGINTTRALTCKFNAQLTAGRVQTPTLAMVVAREQKIKEFKPSDFWTLKADFGGYYGHWRDKNNNNGRIFQQERAQEILAKVQGGEGIIEEIRRENKSEQPPLAYDLTELQRDANHRYSFSAQKTLSVLQGLYERHKVVTYPRTDSRYITSDIVPTLAQRLQSMATGPYQKWAQEILANPIKPGKRFVDDSKVSDHHAIIPTEQRLNLDDFDSEERKLYDLIAKRFLTVLFPPYRYEKTTIKTIVNGEAFYSNGKVILDLGWRNITMYASQEKGDEESLPEQTLQQQEKGLHKKVVKCQLEKGKTSPPPRYTEASLLTDMESAGKFIEDEDLRESIKQGGLGTPATRAEIIEKLLAYSYMERKGKELCPTSKGTQLISLVPPELKSAELTARWEQRLSNIAKGKESDKKFMDDIRANAKVLIHSVREDESTYHADNITKHKCPTCGKFMLLVNGKKGKDLLCQDRTCGFRKPEKEPEFGGRISPAEARYNKMLVQKYSDHAKAVTNVGDLLREALAKKDKDKK